MARGARVFREKTFLITDSAGINSPMGFGNPVRNSCVFCHNMSQMGNDVAPGQVDLGTTTLPFADPAPHLPLFRITCLKDPHPHYGRTHPHAGSRLRADHRPLRRRGQDHAAVDARARRARALLQQWLAKDLAGVIEYYERRYNIGYTEQEKQDLVNLMGAL